MKPLRVTRAEWILVVLLTAAATLDLLTGFASAEPTADEMRTTVTYIASDKCAGRETGSPGIYRAQQYVAEQLREAGLDPRYQEFRVNNRKCRNLVAFVQGASNKYIVVGAHIDHIGTRGRRIMNGADDNASGSAMALAMAIDLHKQQGMSLVPPRHSIVFVWFTGEEHRFWGSEYFAKNPLAPVQGKLKAGASLPIFMLNLDMVGRLHSAYPGREEFPPVDTLPIVEILERLYRQYDFGKTIVLRDGKANSDHAPFYERGVPYVFLHTGLHADYHRSTDDADKINYVGMLKVTRFAQDLIDAILRVDEVEYDFINGITDNE